ncbi:ABC transporter ATP-binding protein [Nocardioides albidus]|uniref:ABC transporter ATP-binding protein n=1 Tax=Nocardioides albidus TaxID=1517589 RepID=A0A5C4VLI3_9ACTN|nr:ABC transporter ATP-binding protein [Nocardioides albidus]TNM36495.1 ABC transporter ATP-binding protein [Nocardioides albidus]
MTALLEVEGLNSGYGRLQVLHDFSVAVEQSTITAVLGANGAGKSTMLKSLSGLVRPTSGKVVFDGEDITKLPVEALIQRGFTHVPEGGGVIPELTVEENLRLGGLWRTGPSAAKTTADAIDEVYDLFERLRERRTFHGHQLSGGERQMLALGRALVAKPKMVLLDEPSLGLAPPIVARIMALLRDLRDQQGLTVLLVEQNVGSALGIADEGVVISVGKVVTRGPAADLQSDVKLRHAYLGF